MSTDLSRATAPCPNCYKKSNHFWSHKRITAIVANALDFMITASVTGSLDHEELAHSHTCTHTHTHTQTPTHAHTHHNTHTYVGGPFNLHVRVVPKTQRCIQWGLVSSLFQSHGCLRLETRFIIRTLRHMTKSATNTTSLRWYMFQRGCRYSKICS